MAQRQQSGRASGEKGTVGPGPVKTVYMDDPLFPEDNEMGRQLMEGFPDLDEEKWFVKFRSWHQKDLADVACSTNAPNTAVACALLLLQRMSSRKQSSGIPISTSVFNTVVDRSSGKAKSQDEKVPTLIAIFHGGTQNLLGIIKDSLALGDGADLSFDVRKIHALPDNGRGHPKADSGKPALSGPNASGCAGQSEDPSGSARPVSD